MAVYMLFIAPKLQAIHGCLLAIYFPPFIAGKWIPTANGIAMQRARIILPLAFLVRKADRRASLPSASRVQHHRVLTTLLVLLGRNVNGARF